MVQSLTAILIIFLILGSGYLVGRVLRPSFRLVLIAKISPIVLVLLFLMGIELGGIFTDPALGLPVIARAFSLALTLSLLTAVLLFKRNSVQPHSTLKPRVTHAFYGCVKAISTFALGVLLFNVTGFDGGHFFISSTFVLYVIVFLSGMDFVGFHWGKVTTDLVRLPLMTIMATVMASAIYPIFFDLTWRETLLSVSGFGWFSLSGPMVKALVSAKMGGMAFMTDFFREIISVFFLYFFGHTQPRAAIGMSGAAALDSALPFIKENCEASYIRYALVSGFMLTLLGPFFIALAITLFQLNAS